MEPVSRLRLPAMTREMATSKRFGPDVEIVDHEHSVLARDQLLAIEIVWERGAADGHGGAGGSCQGLVWSHGLQQMTDRTGPSPG
jgi:hypothetical protein